VNILYLIMGIVLVPFGVTVIYVNQYLARKQNELHRRGFRDVNLFWPYVIGPRPWAGPVLILAGVFFLLFYFLR
jgi:hypothetical protein